MSGPRFLIARLSSLGDVVCSLPAATALKCGFEDAHVTWVVDSRFADVVRCCGSVDTVMERSALDLADSYDCALDLQGLLKSALIVRQAKAKSKLGYHWQREGSALFSSRVMPDKSSLHVADQYVDVARAAGGVADRAEFDLGPDSEALSRVRDKLGDLGPFVVINPGAAWVSKRWPVASAAELADALPVRAVLIGSPNETTASEVAALSKSNPLNLSGKTSIAELIALISLASAHVGGDTGSTHIAAALGIPAIGLYAGTKLERSCPYGQIHRCHYNPDGLARIEPTAVLRTVEEAIS